MHKVIKILIQVAAGSRENRSHDGFSLVEVFLNPSHHIVGKRFHRLVRFFTIVVNLSLFLGGDCFDKAQRKAVFCLSGEFCRPDDGGEIRNVGIHSVAKLRISLGSAAYPSRVEKIVIPDITVADAYAEIRYVVSLDEEGSPFAEESLIGGKVNFRRVCFNLTEVGVNGQIHGHVIGYPDLGVDTSVQPVSPAFITIGIARFGLESFEPGNPIRGDIEYLPGLYLLQPGKLSEHVNKSGCILWNMLPERHFILPVKKAGKLQSPDIT